VTEMPVTPYQFLRPAHAQMLASNSAARGDATGANLSMAARLVGDLCIFATDGRSTLELRGRSRLSPLLLGPAILPRHHARGSSGGHARSCDVRPHGRGLHAGGKRRDPVRDYGRSLRGANVKNRSGSR
jgi:hypothetical protein